MQSKERISQAISRVETENIQRRACITQGLATRTYQAHKLLLSDVFPDFWGQVLLLVGLVRVDHFTKGLNLIVHEGLLLRRELDIVALAK